jgi:fumarate reductase subunit C
MYKKDGRKHKVPHMPARIDVIQSATGVLLALFIAGHLVFESTILIGKDAMLAMTRFFEGYYFFGEAYPWIVSILAAIVFVLFIVHALTALRKFPSSYHQYRIYRQHMLRMQHSDTSLWFWQVVTGFMMFFLGSVHLYMMMANPADIGPYASSDRMVGEWMWPLYLLLLFSVVLHAAIGFYRVVLKWGWFEGKNPRANRMLLKKILTGAAWFYLALGVFSIGTYVAIGIDHADRAGERYHQETHS